MRRPPPSVAFLARTHWLTGGVVFGFIAALHYILRNAQLVQLSPATYAITGALVTLYAVGGTLTWFALPAARALNHVCCALYFVRPPLGAKVWGIMHSEEYRAHFNRA
jgi:hypothetical protein